MTERAQERLKAGRVLVIGAGGLGSPALLYLAAAGVGRITIVDADCVALSNLQRQVLYASAGVGEPKAAAAAGVAFPTIVTGRALGRDDAAAAISATSAIGCQA